LFIELVKPLSPRLLEIAALFLPISGKIAIRQPPVGECAPHEPVSRGTKTLDKVASEGFPAVFELVIETDGGIETDHFCLPQQFMVEHRVREGEQGVHRVPGRTPVPMAELERRREEPGVSGEVVSGRASLKAADGSGLTALTVSQAFEYHLECRRGPCEIETEIGPRVYSFGQELELTLDLAAYQFLVPDDAESREELFILFHAEEAVVVETALESSTKARVAPGEEEDCHPRVCEMMEHRCFNDRRADHHDPAQGIDGCNALAYAVGVEGEGIAVELYVDVLPIDVEGSHAFFSPYVEELRVARLDGHAHGVSCAPAIHDEYMDPVFCLLDEMVQLIRHDPQLPIREEAFVDGLLPARAIALQEAAHLVEPPPVGDVVGDNVERSLHGKRIRDNPR